MFFSPIEHTNLGCVPTNNIENILFKSPAYGYINSFAFSYLSLRLLLFEVELQSILHYEVMIIREYLESKYSNWNPGVASAPSGDLATLQGGRLCSSWPG